MIYIYIYEKAHDEKHVVRTYNITKMLVITLKIYICPMKEKVVSKHKYIKSNY